MRIRRPLAVAAVALAAFAPAAQAQSILPPIIQPILEGCYGVVVTVCDPHVTSRPYSFSSTPVPVCTGSCEEVDVPTPELNGEPLCVAWTDHTGASRERCAP